MICGIDGCHKWSTQLEIVPDIQGKRRRRAGKSNLPIGRRSTARAGGKHLISLLLWLVNVLYKAFQVRHARVWCVGAWDNLLLWMKKWSRPVNPRRRPEKT